MGENYKVSCEINLSKNIGNDKKMSQNSNSGVGVEYTPPPQTSPLSTGCNDHWSWNKRDKSHKVYLYGSKQRIAHFHPNWSNGTAGV